MNSNTVKPEKFDHLHLDYHFTVPLTNLSELINFYSSWIHQKTNGFRMISEGIEGHQFAWNSRNIRSEIWRWSYASEIRQRSLRTNSKNWRTSRTEENKDFFSQKTSVHIFYKVLSGRKPERVFSKSNYLNIFWSDEPNLYLKIKKCSDFVVTLEYLGKGRIALRK